MKARLAWTLACSLLLTSVANMAEAQGLCERCPRCCDKPMINLFVKSIEPREPVENTPIAISFELRSTRALAGTVYYPGPAAPALGPAGIDIPTLPAGHVRSGKVYGLAPKAGRDVRVDIIYCEKAAEFCPEVARGGDDINIAACYDLRVNHFRAETTRDNYLRGHGQDPKDFVVGAATALFGGEHVPHPRPETPGQPPGTQTESYGWYRSGSLVPTNLWFRPICGVPGVAPDLETAFLFERAAKAEDIADKKKVLGLISEINKGVATGLLPAFSGAWEGVDKLHKAIMDELFADCDGLLAVDKDLWRSDVLASITDNVAPSQEARDFPTNPHRIRITSYRDKGIYAEERRYRGYTSPGGCGTDISIYDVKFTFDRFTYPGR